ncbi:transmembrane protein 201 [Xyrauchen texanus]|uniref:transmembrane protein 201 n=1 Tax=Xyrauchen texanus TaxID=154827 RepID=UPI002242A1E9|nr:transmembrane protein 201 [Xyrauchen texanus]
MEAFNQILLQYPPFIVGGVGVTAVAAGGALIYKLATRKKPTHVIVNCWFCNQDTVVPYGNRNCWDCPYCEQYNGFQENGDYNKPIPAQYMEHLNHGVSAGVPESPKTLQWVNCQMLLCRKCNNNQTLKIKQLASFIPRDDENYDEEIEVYKHHLEQTYKLCRPCQTAVEYYIKYQNRQLRALLFNHQLRRSRDADKAFVKNTYSLTTPAWLILLRVLAFLACAFLVAVALSGSGDPDVSSSVTQPLSGGVALPKPSLKNDSETKANEGSMMWNDFVGLLPEEAMENARLVWQSGSDNQMAVASVGLLTCITGVLMAGPIRLRRIDAVASVLWLLVMCFYLAEFYLQTDIPDWLETVKFGIMSVCCLVGFASAVATRKSTSLRRARGRRYLSGSSPGLYYSNHSPLSAPVSGSSTFIPTPPPNLSHLLIRQQSHRTRKASPSSLPGRLNRALSLGTIPSLARADSGFLFSGSRPSQCKDSPPSDYFSLKSGSRPSSPGPSPTPSVAGSVTSTSSSARQRRPLISPARLNISGQKLQLFSSPLEPFRLPSPSPFLSEQSHVHSRGFLPDVLNFHSHNQGSLIDEGSVFEHMEKRKGSSSVSSNCHVDTTTGDGSDGKSGWRGFLGLSLWPGLLFASLSINLTFICFYLYYN